MRKTRRRHAGLNLIERAYFAKQWEAEAIDAQIKALIGDDSANLTNSAGRILFVALGAAMAQRMDPETLELRVIRGAVDAVHDQAGEAEIPAARRQSIVSGLEAVDRLMPQFERTHLIDAAINLELRLTREDIRLSDFEALVPSGEI